MRQIGPRSHRLIKTTKVYVVVKNDGTRFYGYILSQDAREVLIETKELLLSTSLTNCS